MSSLTKFRVPDLVESDSEFTFILESPHHEEIKEGYPAAGPTGAWMSKVLFDLEIPLGKLVATKSASITRSLSLMNCSRLPLQLSCYGSEDLPKDYLSFLDIKTIKYTSFPLYKNEVKKKLKSKVGLKALKNFKERLMRSISSCNSPKLIVCGVIAQCFFEEATGREGELRELKHVTCEGHSFIVFYEYHPSPECKKWQGRDNMADLLGFMS